MTTHTPRPTVDFSGNRVNTDADKFILREYAKAANSRVLSPNSQWTLKAAAQGLEVDAYRLNEALLEAMAAASTRLGQSMARRQLTRKIAHLGNVVQAVLDAHADTLPEGDVTERASRIEEQAAYLADADEQRQKLEAEVAQLRRERTTLTQAASDERRRLCAEIDRLAAEAGALQRIVEQTAKGRDRWLAATYYAIDLTDAETGARVRGYIDGWNEAKA